MFLMVPGTPPGGGFPLATSFIFVSAGFAALCRLDARHAQPITTVLEPIVEDWSQNLAGLLANDRLCAQLEFLHAACYQRDPRAITEYVLGMFSTGLGKTVLSLLPARILDVLDPLSNNMERVTYIRTPLKACVC
jgi:hypothetical protein